MLVNHLQRSRTISQPVIHHVALTGSAYDVAIGPRLLGSAGKLIADRVPSRRAAIIADDTVAAIHGGGLRKALAAADIQADTLSVPPGESSKSLAQVERLAERLAELHFDRQSPIIALGGGMIGDLAGFTAATWLRGVPFINCTTTTEGAIDASTGGKTAVNLKAGKNLVGAFHQPRLVLIDTDTFRTLPPRDFRAGLAEAVKHGLIRDAALLDWLAENGAAIADQDESTIVELVRRNVAIKASVVRDDEHETGGSDGIGRAALNFGHTIGHAVEAAANYELRHGEAVAIGLVAALKLGRARGLTPPEVVEKTSTALTALGLPISPPTGLDAAALWPYMARDKKAAAGRVRFLLLRETGRLEWAEDVRAEEVAATFAAT